MFNPWMRAPATGAKWQTKLNSFLRAQLHQMRACWCMGCTLTEPAGTRSPTPCRSSSTTSNTALCPRYTSYPAGSLRMLWPCLLQSLLGTSSSMTVPCTVPSSGQASSPPQVSLPTSSQSCLYPPRSVLLTGSSGALPSSANLMNETNSILTVYTKAMSELFTN